MTRGGDARHPSRAAAAPDWKEGRKRFTSCGCWARYTRAECDEPVTTPPGLLLMFRLWWYYTHGRYAILCRVWTAAKHQMCLHVHILVHCHRYDNIKYDNIITRRQRQHDLHTVLLSLCILCRRKARHSTCGHMLTSANTNRFAKFSHIRSEGNIRLASTSVATLPCECKNSK